MATASLRSQSDIAATSGIKQCFTLCRAACCREASGTGQTGHHRSHHVLPGTSHTSSWPPQQAPCPGYKDATDKYKVARNSAAWGRRKPKQEELLSTVAINNLQEKAEASSSHGLITVILGFVFKLLI